MDAFHLAWTLYILIPVLHSLYDCVRKRAVSHFAYPILITFIYMLLGFTTGLWHPMWVLYITIPIFYSIATAIDRAMRRKKRAKEIGS